MHGDPWCVNTFVRIRLQGLECSLAEPPLTGDQGPVAWPSPPLGRSKESIDPHPESLGENGASTQNR